MESSACMAHTSDFTAHALTKLYFRVEPVKSTWCKRRVLQTVFTNYVSVFTLLVLKLIYFHFQKHKEELHTAKISLIIVVLVLTCWFPFYTTLLVLRVGLFNSKTWPNWMKYSTHLLVAVYPSLSPCVFAFRCKKLQKELRKMFHKSTDTLRLQNTSQNDNEFYRIRKSIDYATATAETAIPEKATLPVSTSAAGLPVQSVPEVSCRLISTIHLDASQRSSLSSQNTTESALSEATPLQQNTAATEMKRLPL